MWTPDLVLSAVRALWEVPTPSLRCVAITEADNWINMRFVYEVHPTALERDLASSAAAEVIADFPDLRIRETLEVAAPPAPRELAEGERWVYLRYESIDR